MPAEPAGSSDLGPLLHDGLLAASGVQGIDDDVVIAGSPCRDAEVVVLDGLIRRLVTGHEDDAQGIPIRGPAHVVQSLLQHTADVLFAAANRQ